jgi:hypothetical protein
MQNKQHQGTQIDVIFSGPVNTAVAQSLANYQLVQAGTSGSFTGKGATVLKLKSAVYKAALDEVILTPATPFALTRPVQFTINGTSSTGLHDTIGRLIDGGHTGHAGSNDVVVISTSGVS